MKVRWFLANQAIALVAVLATAAPAFASGSFTWTATFKGGLDSRTWTQAGGSTTITAKISCDPNTNGYYVELYKNQLIDKSYGRVRYSCGSGQRYTWTGLPSGTYHFHLSKANDGVAITGSGSVTYP
ncbi:hypothetical protein [Marmoricola sp. RAF53]|uniref:hypothetical protein n=1 Tax=Marmoricola sp. RAF53 TaxID=3233059 RepID=UPI003F9DA0A6